MQIKDLTKDLLLRAKKSIKANWIYLIVLILVNSLFIFSIKNNSYMANETFRFYILFTSIAIIVSALSDYAVWHRIFVLLITALYCYMYVEAYTVGLVAKPRFPLTIFLNVTLYFLIAFILYTLIKRMSVSLCINQVFWLILGYASFLLRNFRGNPLFLSDVTSIGTALEVSGEYTPIINIWIIIQFVALIGVPLALHLVLSKNEVSRLEFKPKFRAIGAVLSAAALLSLYNEYSLTQMGYEASWWWHKSSTGFMINTILEAETYGIQKNKDYSPDKIEKIREENTVENSEISKDLPDIICVMNESFSDLSVIGDFETTQDYLSYFNSLKEEDNCISGNLYVSVKGGNTANTEYEFLTGGTTAIYNYGMIPYNTYIKDNISTNVSAMESLGYSTLAFHPWKKTGWNRPNVYSFMDFDKMFFYEDLLNKKSIEKFRSYPSDSYDYAKVEEYYNDMPDKPRFIFNITMQNHGGYADKEFLPNVQIAGVEGKYPLAEQYLSIMSYSDSALEELVEYYRNVDRRVIICFFGDHQPKVENNFFIKLFGKNLESLSQEEMEKQYITPFIIWANYDIPKENVDKISSNYLFAYLAKTAGLKLTPFQNYLLKLYEKYPVISGVGAIDSQDNYYTPTEMNELEDIREYYDIIYNQIFDTENTVEDFFD